MRNGELRLPHRFRARSWRWILLNWAERSPARKKKLDNSTIRVDTGCIVAFTEGVTYDIERAGNLKSMFFGGEGLFLATLRGTGTVLLQSLPFSRLADRILAHAPSQGGSNQGEGSVLGGLGNLFGD